MDQEKLGPAERLIQSVLAYTDHGVHNRPGIVTPDPQSAVRVKWQPVTHKEEGGRKVVYRLDKVGKKTTQVRLGFLSVETNRVMDDHGRFVGEYRPAGLFPEVIEWLYQQVADIYKMDNEFAAHWASFAFEQDHRDLKCVLAAFMLVQERKGDPVVDGGKIVFHDDDFRDVGEAMMLIQKKDKDLNPKLLLRIHDILSLPQVAKINRDLKFGKSARKPFYGRWTKVVEKWLEHRTTNIKLLEGLVKAGFRTTVMELARRVGFKPETTKFFEVLRWKQKQSDDGRRQLAIGAEVKKAESWAGFSEKQICEAIEKTKPGFKRIVGFLPQGQGLTRAIVTCAIENNCLSDKDIVISSVTLEELGLLDHPLVKPKWEDALKKQNDMRAANIAQRMKSTEKAEKLEQAADTALQAQVAAVLKDIRIYVCVDISSSMAGAIQTAKMYLGRFLQAFPLDKLHVSVFNTNGKVVVIKHASAGGIEQAFRGFSANGGTSYASGVAALSAFKPKDDEDTLMIFVGDEEDSHPFAMEVQRSGLRPMAFGMLKVPGGFDHRVVHLTAAALGIPCIPIDDRIFADPYAIPRTIRNLIAATPVGQVAAVHRPVVRQTLVDQIIKTKLLEKPAWAS